MISYKKLLRCLLAVVILLALFFNLAGCSKNDAKMCQPQYIDETFGWYSCETQFIDDSVVGNLDNANMLYADDKCRVFYKYIDENTYETCNILSYISDENEISTLDLTDRFSGCESFTIRSCFCIDGVCYASILRTEEGIQHSEIYKIDVDNNTLEFTFEFDEGLRDSTYYVDRIICKNDCYYVRICYLEGNYYKDAFYIFDSDFNVVNTLDFEGEVVKWTLNDNDQIIVVEYDRSDMSNYYFRAVTVDLRTSELALLDIDSDTLGNYVGSASGYVSDDGFAYFSNADLTLSRLNFSTGEETTIADFNNTDINLFDLECSILCYCDDEHIVLTKQTYYPSEPLNWVCYSLTKENINPNIGKQILYVAPYFQLNSLAASAIQQMNKSSDSTYVYVTMRYSALLFDDYEITDDSTINRYNKNIALLTKLKQDIANGAGPDILLDFGKFSTLNDGEYLSDILPIISDADSFDRGEYFDNIFDAFAEDNKLFQLPVSACIGGIYTDENAVAGAGFTFDEYTEYVENSCDGFDPMGYEFGKDGCFDMLIRSSYEDLYTDSHTFNADNDSFRSICNYVSNLSGQSNLAGSSGGTTVQEFYRIHFDLSKMVIREDKNLFGLPSTNGDKGPIVFPYETVGITTCTSQFASAFEFVRSILCYDVQISNVSYNPVNRAAFMTYAEDAIDYSNSYIESTFRRENYNSENIIDEYIRYICSADTPYMGDDYSIFIMNEELQSFYENQKTLDEVIVIIDNRISNLLEESK